MVLPAPFGPSRPTSCPFSTPNETSSTATVEPNVLRRWVMVSMMNLRIVAQTGVAQRRALTNGNLGRMRGYLDFLTKAAVPALVNFASSLS